MKIIIAPDSFKECCRAVDVARAIATGVRQCCPAAEIIQIPLSDGGEGLLQCFPGEHEKVISQVTGPTGKSVNAEYMIINHTGKQTAIIEMSAAAGIELIGPEERNPLLTTTYGVGELILDAWHKGCRDFYIGLGSSATCDCGTGMAQALGIEFFDESGLLIEPHMNASLNHQVKNISCKNLKIPLMTSRFTA
ncbi:MAG: glycerate kinase, partial [Sedimentisphaerales bacterium]|nr:glycerate kinase [Sedimentisphaerales bacterium]